MPIKIFSYISLFSDQSILMQFKDEASNIEELMSQTLTLGESNSLLIIGPHGCGKSAVRTN